MRLGSVYPRWRGEHLPLLTMYKEQGGLSPLARGTLSPDRRSDTPGRFIPAGAGNTVSEKIARWCPPVYPRWRGEHVLYIVVGFLCAGLSPLARGTRVYSSYESNSSRFIPAGAGNTFFLTSKCTNVAVYPRWRGEHIMTDVKNNRIVGLSPLARGTLTLFTVHGKIIRFIPAGAGNTILSR